ncbi:N-terminal acetyltransferase B complex auxiliary subunit NAA25 isoform X2 [Cornus florida]|uniref:N-terminal acetyltransferase B complex auxiliary subunit NAA25 isoform X2 n=1 Tax=Cornus florida TaxID=4283 RepID=UPI00289F5DEE|nr:N-terminal acetyltransferase B complex auxiliary subunit NAA25 isoform X2 [Cornus florida]
MASKLGMPGGILERRVRPIWDAIDSGQFKNALRLSATLVTKHPNSPYALAIKALILERMEKNDEALSVCVNAKKLLYTDGSIIDDITLSTLQIVLQRLDHLDMATGCYEYVCGKFPNNLELMIGLFNCYVREYSFVKQQQIAIKMYKISCEERFLLWAVCSIQLQVFSGNGGEKLLLLAEGLLNKHIGSHSLHEPEALIVYISVLEQQSKYGDALEILSGKLGSLIMIEVDKLRIQGRLLARVGDYVAAADVFQKVLELCPDDWECFIHYLGCLLEDDSCWCKDGSSDPIHAPGSVNCKVLHLTHDVFDSRISSASAFVRELLEEANSNSIRCPYLANLEIERRKLLYRKGEEEKLIEALMEYFIRFGHLACFSSDVEMFLHDLTHEKKKWFLKKIGEIEPHSSEPTQILGQFITVLKIQELVGNMFTIPADELEGFAILVAKMYCKNLPLSKDLDVQESMHGEELLSMACNVLVQLFWRTRHLGYLLESILVLEFGLTIRRYVWQYKILLLHLYSYWGALSLAYERYKSLEVKNILLETVSHHMLPQMFVSPLWIDLNDFLKDYLKFMDGHLRESADLTFLAYRHRNYSKAIEFVQFKERLQRSSQYLIAKIEAPILQLKQNADSIKEEERVLESLKCGMDFVELSNEIRSNSLTFNEDLQLRPWWTPTYDKNYLLGPFEGVSYCPRENSQHHIKQMEANVPKAIERRSLLPRLIYLSIQCASSSLKEKIEANGSIFDPKVTLELKILLERYAKMLGYPFQDAIELVFGVSSGQDSSEVLNSELIDWMNFAVFYNAWNLTSREPPDSDNAYRPGTWHVVNYLLEKYIIEKVRSIGLLVSSPGSDLPILVQLVTESLAWHVLIIQSCLRPSVPPGKKKKKGGSVERSNTELYNEISESIQTQCSILEEVTKWLREQINRPVDGDLEMLLSTIKGNEGPGKVFQVLISNFSTTKEMEEVGDRIYQAVNSFNSDDIVRKIVTGQHTVLSEFLKICDSKIKSLQALKLPVQR